MKQEIVKIEEKSALQVQNEDILSSWIEGQLSMATRKAYLKELKSFVEWISAGKNLKKTDRMNILLNTTVKDLVSYRNELNGIKAPATVARALGALKSLFKYLLAMDLIPKNPAEMVKLPKVSDESTSIALEQRDIERLINSIHTVKDPLKRSRDLLINLLMFMNGLRRSEVCKIRRGDFERQGIYDVLRIHSKGGKIDLTKVKPIVKSTFENYISELENHGFSIKNDEFLFRNFSNFKQQTSENGGISTHSIYLMIKKYARLAKLPDSIVSRLHPHCARHSSITIVVDKAGIHKAVQFARHSDPKTTMRYYRRKNDLSVHGTDFINLEVSLSEQGA